MKELESARAVRELGSSRPAAAVARGQHRVLDGGGRERPVAAALGPGRQDGLRGVNSVIREGFGAVVDWLANKVAGTA